MKRKPLSDVNTTVFKFSPAYGSVGREARYQWWKELAKVGIFVRQLCEGSGIEMGHGTVLCDAYPGSPGQAVVQTPKGTLILTSTGRVRSPNPKQDLLALLRIVFPPFDEREAGSAILAERAPVQRTATTFTFSIE